MGGRGGEGEGGGGGGGGKEIGGRRKKWGGRGEIGSFMSIKTSNKQGGIGLGSYIS